MWRSIFPVICTRSFSRARSMGLRLRSRSFLSRRERSAVIVYVCTLVLCYVLIQLYRSNGRQSDYIDYIADNIVIKVKLTPKLPMPSSITFMTLTLNNTGPRDFESSQWRIYFTQLTRVEQYSSTCGLRLSLVAGRVYYLFPDPGFFTGIPSGGSISCEFVSYNKPIKHAQLPNWYVETTARNGYLRVIENTRSENMEFVSVEEKEVERRFNQLVAQQRRYNRFLRMQNTEDRYKIVPTPSSVTKHNFSDISLDADCVILNTHGFNGAISLLTKRLELSVIEYEDLINSRYTCVIKFIINKTMGREQYHLKINGTSNEIKIIASKNAGAFYAAQSLLSLHSFNGTVPSCLIKDKPRFGFRGLMLDVARNFHSVETIVTLLETMAMYKLNKFHFHLTDDEGWRVEIPSIPELTNYASRRCHKMEGNKCLLPSFGSHPGSDDHGSGFYTVNDYQYILRVAENNNILVIPEIDIPGHAKAILKAMKYWKTYPNLSKSNPRSRSMVLFDQGSLEYSVQGWQHNVINPCMNSSYELISLILDELKHMHKGIQTLQLVHLGGDEVQWTIWDNSESCRSLYGTYAQDHAFLKRVFTKKVASIAEGKTLDVIFWNDAVIDRNNEPHERPGSAGQSIYTNLWYIRSNNNDIKTVSQFTDAGYKVILSMASHFYFDHSYESDFDEFGQQWATDFIDTLKVFNTIPCSYRLKYSQQECSKRSYPGNIAGMQASIWGEILRGRTKLMHMLFPRLLALAERAWHKASWENITDIKIRELAVRKDWNTFANTLGHKEFLRLEKMGVTYRVPPPGAYVADTGHLFMYVNVAYPNHKIYMKWDPNDPKWQIVDTRSVAVYKNLTILLKSVSLLLKRSSKIVYIYT